jgi:hypothetical protein
MQLRALLIGLSLGTLGAVLLQRLLGQNDLVEPTELAVSTTSTPERANDEPQASDDLSRLSTPELYRRAQAGGIAGRSNMTKAQLVEALRKANR